MLNAITSATVINLRDDIEIITDPQGQVGEEILQTFVLVIHVHTCQHEQSLGEYKYLNNRKYFE